MDKLGDVEKLVKTIIEGAQQEAEKVISKAREKADELVRKAVAEARRKAEAEAEVIVKTAKDEALRRRRSDVAKARMDSMRMVLDVKEKLIESVAEEAKKKILEMAGSEEYKASLKAMIEEAIRVLGGGVIELVLNERDMKLGIDLHSIAKKLSNELGRKVELKLSSEPGRFLGGVVARSLEAGIEVDYTVEGILERKWKELRVKVAKQLFGE